MSAPRASYLVSLLVPLVIIAALAVVIGAVLSTQCTAALDKGYLLECHLK